MSEGTLEWAEYTNRGLTLHATLPWNGTSAVDYIVVPDRHVDIIEVHVMPDIDHSNPVEPQAREIIVRWTPEEQSYVVSKSHMHLFWGRDGHSFIELERGVPRNAGSRTVYRR